MKNVIVDCDNTIGVEGCDVDDGLAILYLLGRPDIRLLGITTVYGNSDLDTVYNTTVSMMEEIGRSNIPVIRGCSGAGERRSDAAKFIVETVNENEGDISILAIGPLTNLYAAYRMDENIFDKVNEIVAMGGITQELVINGHILDELNFSCDPEGTKTVLMNGRNVAVLTGNSCLDVLFSYEDFSERLISGKRSRGRYILDKCSRWSEHTAKAFNVGGFHPWDVIAAVRLAEPSLFRPVQHTFKPGINLLKRGFLTSEDIESLVCTIDAPRVKNIQELTDEVYGAWLV
jgi:purine nucleosidase